MRTPNQARAPSATALHVQAVAKLVQHSNFKSFRRRAMDSKYSQQRSELIDSLLDFELDASSATSRNQGSIARARRKLGTRCGTLFV